LEEKRAGPAEQIMGTEQFGCDDNTADVGAMWCRSRDLRRVPLVAPSKIVCSQDYQRLALVQIGLNFTHVESQIGRHVDAVAVVVERGQCTVQVSHLFRVNVRERPVSHTDAHGTNWLLTFDGHPEPNCPAAGVNVSMV
jgi:hypothetical protein